MDEVVEIKTLKLTFSSFSNHGLVFEASFFFSPFSAGNILL